MIDGEQMVLSGWVERDGTGQLGGMDGRRQDRGERGRERNKTRRVEIGLKGDVASGVRYKVRQPSSVARDTPASQELLRSALRFTIPAIGP